MALTLKDLPTLLTIARLIAAPIVAGLILAADYATLAMGAGAGAAFFGGGMALFALAALTDAADGMLARRLGAVTTLGASLDHAADKALTSCTLIALAATVLSRDLIVAAMLLIARDVVIGGLREGMALAGRALPVSQAGKTKTALILVGIGAVMLLQVLTLTNGAGPMMSKALDYFATFALWGGVLLSAWSAWAYVEQAAKPQAQA